MIKWHWIVEVKQWYRFMVQVFALLNATIVIKSIEHRTRAFRVVWFVRFNYELRSWHHGSWPSVHDRYGVSVGLGVFFVRARGVWVIFVDAGSVLIRLYLCRVTSRIEGSILLAFCHTASTSSRRFKSAVPGAVSRPKDVDNRHSPKHIGHEALHDRIQVVHELADANEVAIRCRCFRGEKDGLRVQIAIQTDKRQTYNDKPHVLEHSFDVLLHLDNFLFCFKPHFFADRQLLLSCDFL